MRAPEIVEAHLGSLPTFPSFECGPRALALPAHGVIELGARILGVEMFADDHPQRGAHADLPPARKVRCPAHEPRVEADAEGTGYRLHVVLFTTGAMSSQRRSSRGGQTRKRETAYNQPCARAHEPRPDPHRRARLLHARLCHLRGAAPAASRRVVALQRAG